MLWYLCEIWISRPIFNDRICFFVCLKARAAAAPVLVEKPCHKSKLSRAFSKLKIRKKISAALPLHCFSSIRPPSLYRWCWWPQIWLNEPLERSLKKIRRKKSYSEIHPSSRDQKHSCFPPQLTLFPDKLQHNVFKIIWDNNNACLHSWYSVFKTCEIDGYGIWRHKVYLVA